MNSHTHAHIFSNGHFPSKPRLAICPLDSQSGVILILTSSRFKPRLHAVSDRIPSALLWLSPSIVSSLECIVGCWPATYSLNCRDYIPRGFEVCTHNHIDWNDSNHLRYYNNRSYNISMHRNNETCTNNIYDHLWLMPSLRDTCLLSCLCWVGH